MRTNRLIICQTGSVCACGALTRDGDPACEKCVSRARWARRKARRTFRQSRRQDLGCPSPVNPLRRKEVID